MANSTTSLADLPYEQDADDFGTRRYVDGLVNFIHNSAAPVTIALQGEWGSGKTSLMNRLKKRLCDEENAAFIPVVINTWEYSMMSTPDVTVFKIIERLVNSLAKGNLDTRNIFRKFVNGVGGMAYRFGREYLKGVTPGIAASVVEAIVPSELPGGGEADDVSVTELREALEKAIDKTIRGDKKKKGVIVFVDDLDRLNPPVAVEILEILKNIFSLRNCIFILAIDYEVVVKGLEPKFGKLTERNEREFRSFFDKIIQVPFSLPVNSYKPMAFVMRSLREIGYISEHGSDMTEAIHTIVELSVGKNPRSIKRLINTLSLLRCIAACGSDANRDFTESQAGRIVNFAIVAIQVCYPKIYRMLASMPDFRQWDLSIVARFNIPIKVAESDAPGIEWEEILEAACSTDSYLTSHATDIRTLLNLIADTVATRAAVEGTDTPQLADAVRSIIDKSSVTGINAPQPAAEVDMKRLISILHRNIMSRITARRPDIDRWQYKRNTGNGGVFIYLPDGSFFDVIIRPRTAVGGNGIMCEFILRTEVRRPERLMGQRFDEMLADPAVAEAMAVMDRAVRPLLERNSWFTGRNYPESDFPSSFSSFSEEQRFRCLRGWNDILIAADVSYFITRPNDMQFDDVNVTEAIADIVIALYDFRRLAADIK